MLPEGHVLCSVLTYDAQQKYHTYIWEIYENFHICVQLYRSIHVYRYTVRNGLWLSLLQR